MNSPNALQTFREIHDKISAEEDGSDEVWNYSECIAEFYASELSRLAPAIEHTGKLTLADLAARATFYCEYRVVDENPQIGSIEAEMISSPESEPPGEWDIRSRQSVFPALSPSDVEVPYDNGWTTHSIIPQRVYFKGEPYFYKAAWSPSDSIDEIEKYTRLVTSGMSEKLLTSKVFAIVANSHGETKGLLYHWIEARDILSLVVDKAPLSLRQSWASQIRHTVTQLHSLGIVWGDVKSDNVLIDVEDNAIVIDLEGGTTRGWVEHDVGGTIEGDMQGLGKLLRFILDDKSPLRYDNAAD